MITTVVIELYYRIGKKSTLLKGCSDSANESNLLSNLFREEVPKSQGFHESDYFVAQRLKRVPSIVMKLRRLRTRLSQMQDIAGLRVVLPSVKDVREFHEALVNSNAKHEARLPAKDYILAPKKDGYRSIHQIFKYRNAKHADLNVLSVEVQIRTRLQHAWATAVETLGAIEHSSFKTGEGTDEVKQFFKLSSALMSHHEGTPVLDELANIDIKQCVATIRNPQKRQ